MCCAPSWHADYDMHDICQFQPTVIYPGGTTLAHVHTAGVHGAYLFCPYVYSIAEPVLLPLQCKKFVFNRLSVLLAAVLSLPAAGTGGVAHGCAAHDSGPQPAGW